MSESDLSMSAQDRANELGLIIRRPADNELFIDIDSQADLTHFQSTIALLELLDDQWAQHGYTLAQTPSASGEPFHVHIVVSSEAIRPLTDVDRLLYQTLLGSDRKHELLSLLRLRSGARPEDVTVFFEKAAA